MTDVKTTTICSDGKQQIKTILVCGPTRDTNWQNLYLKELALYTKTHNVAVVTGCGDGLDRAFIHHCLQQGLSNVGIASLTVYASQKDWGKHNNLQKLFGLQDQKSDEFLAIIGALPKDGQTIDDVHFEQLMTMAKTKEQQENISTMRAAKGFKIRFCDTDYEGRDKHLCALADECIGYTPKGVNNNGTAGNLACIMLKDCGMSIDDAWTAVIKGVKDRGAALSVYDRLRKVQVPDETAHAVQTLLELRAVL